MSSLFVRGEFITSIEEILSTEHLSTNALKKKEENYKYFSIKRKDLFIYLYSMFGWNKNFLASLIILAMMRMRLTLAGRGSWPLKWACDGYSMVQDHVLQVYTV